MASDTPEITEGDLIPKGFSHAIRGEKEYLFFRNEGIVMEFLFPKGMEVTCELTELDAFENPHFSFGEEV